MKKGFLPIATLIFLCSILCACSHSPIENSSNSTVPSTTLSTTPSTQGDYSIDDLQSAGATGFFIQYKDGSFDRYHSGKVLSWEGPRLMTYGNEYFYQHLIIDAWRDNLNEHSAASGQVVLFCSNSTRFRSDLTPIEFGGNTISTTHEEKDAALFFYKKHGNYGADIWIHGKGIQYINSKSSITINDVPLDAWCSSFSFDNSRSYASLNEWDELSVSIGFGATLYTYEGSVDQHFYFQKQDETQTLNLIPTTQGYAILDFTDIPAGEYIYNYSYWDESARGRVAYVTRVIVN